MLYRYHLCSADPRLLTKRPPAFNEQYGDVLLKPFDITELLTTVQRLIARAASTRRTARRGTLVGV